MSKFALLSQIIRGAWLIDGQAAIGYLPLIEKLIAGQPVSYWDDDDEEEIFGRKIAVTVALANGVVASYSSYDEAPEGSVAIIGVKGALMKNDYCGAPGTSTLAANLREADNHPNISASILKIDSPGGHVDGTEHFARIAKSTQKPLVSFVDGLMCSAAYWIGSSANMIIAGGRTAQIGSIGTMISISDFRQYYEQMGVKFHDVRATDSKDKNETFYQLLKGNYEPIQKQMLNPINDIFLSHVKENRAGLLDLKKENVLTGKVYLAEACLENGLIDGIGTFEEAVELAMKLSKKSK